MIESGTESVSDFCMTDQDAQDINQMMSGGVDTVLVAPKKSKLLWVVLGCVVVGVGLGVVVYQQSLKPPTPIKTTPRPTSSVTPVIPSPVPSPTDNAVTPGVSVIQPASKVVTFPKAGTVQIYFDGGGFGAQPELVRLTLAGQVTNVTMPKPPVSAGAKMFTVPTTLKVAAGDKVNVEAFDLGNVNTPAYGWVAPNAQGQCVGSAGINDVSPMITWLKAQVGVEPIVAQMCWADNGNPPDDFNDFFMALSYVPSATAPSPSTTASSTPTPSPSPSPSKAASPSPSASVVASVTPTPTPSASARAAMPDTSGGTPVTGVFEVTVGTISVGLILLVLGLVGLLAL